MVSRSKRCPVTEVAELLSDSWTILILHRLLATPSEPVRYCELERSLSGISTRTLANKLRDLVDRGMARRDDDGYTLTALGRRISPVIEAMERFGRAL